MSKLLHLINVMMEKMLHASMEYQEATSGKFYVWFWIFYRSRWEEENEAGALKKLSQKITHDGVPFNPLP
jgi:hypothetical protein